MPIDPLVLATSKPESVAATKKAFKQRWREDATFRAEFGNNHAEFLRQLEASILQTEESQIWINSTYQVIVRDLSDGWVHLSIRRLDRKPVHDWRDLQQIKNQLLGEGCEAIELYPAEERLVDSANQYHLFGSRDPEYRFPFGFQSRLAIENPPGAAVNRAFDE